MTTDTQKITRPWRRRTIRRPRPDVVVTGAEPLAQITIYPDTTLLTRRSGASWRQHPISAEALAQTFANVPTATGLLPPGTLGAGRVHGTPFYVLSIPAQRATLRMEQQDYPIPLPPLIWAGCGNDYRVWALSQTEPPASGSVSPKAAPFPNTYNDGRICWGTTDARVAASSETLLSVLKLFLEGSYFNLHVADKKSVLFPNSVVGMWQHLIDTQAETYPLDDLMPTNYPLGWVLGGGPWK